jgi:organic radical activating enzyme
LIYIVESFYSIQGEGLFAGMPSIFIRFAGCNMRCSGFGNILNGITGCDTIKAVDNRFKDSWIGFDNIDSLKKYFDNLINQYPYINDIVITGGEPTIYFNNSIFYSFIEYIINYNITIETNGTIFIDFEKYPLYKKLIYSISPKLSNSGEKNAINKKSIYNIKDNAKMFFKFVIDERIDISEIRDITSQDDIIYCMPIGDTREILQQNSLYVFEFCKKYRFRYSDRLHIRIYDKRDGV